MFKTNALGMKLSLSSSFIIWVITDKTSAVDLKEWNLYCLLLRRWFLIRWLTTSLLITMSEFANDTKEAEEVILWGKWTLTSILENRVNGWQLLQTWVTFLFKQQLNNFINIGDKTNQIFWGVWKLPKLR